MLQRIDFFSMMDIPQAFLESDSCAAQASTLRNKTKEKK